MSSSSFLSGLDSPRQIGATAAAKHTPPPRQEQNTHLSAALVRACVLVWVENERLFSRSMAPCQLARACALDQDQPASLKSIYVFEARQPEAACLLSTQPPGKQTRQLGRGRVRRRAALPRAARASLGCAGSGDERRGHGLQASRMAVGTTSCGAVPCYTRMPAAPRRARHRRSNERDAYQRNNMQENETRSSKHGAAGGGGGG